MDLKSFLLCGFGHEEPIRVMAGKTYRWECPRCLSDLGRPLPKQKFKARKAPKLKLVRPSKVVGRIA